MILAGDIGGTHTRLAFFEIRGGSPLKIKEETFASREFKGLNEIVAGFAKNEKLQGASFGIAGPVRNGVSHTTNLPWSVDAKELARILHLKSTGLLNDLEANAYGIATLQSDDFLVLQSGDLLARGNQAVISAGTGLGEAGLFWNGTHHTPFASEGGHCDFAPANDVEVELLHYLRAKYAGHVSWERVLSGQGLCNIYDFLTEAGALPSPLKIPAGPDTERAVEISKAGLARACPVCVKALDLFSGFYGAEAGNLALKTMAVGGIFIGGGIAPKILPMLQQPSFLAKFTAKGRFEEWLRKIPVRVILNDQTALWGAARHAVVFLEDH